METTIKVALRQSQSDSEKGYLVWRITRNRLSRSISTAFAVSKEEWNETVQQTTIRKIFSTERKKELKAINAKLQSDRRIIKKIAERLEDFGDFSAEDIEKHFRKHRSGLMFVEYIHEIVKRLEESDQLGTAAAYRYAAVSFLKFLNGVDISIEKINAEMIKSYENRLKQEEKTMNTISCYMRSLRSGYNKAMDENLFLKKHAPFSKVFTGNAKTTKRAINAESVKKIKDVKFDTEAGSPEAAEPGNPPSLWKGLGGKILARDLFMFSFYTQGMTFSDMVNLKKENIKDGFIRYNRKKTGQPVCIEMQNCMQEIISRYEDLNSDFIFPILRAYVHCSKKEQWKQTALALSAFNRKLNQIARQAGIREHLTSYVARHSWASIASQLGIPIATISRGMGHESEKTTRIYISQLDSSDVGKANSRILSIFVA